MTYRTEASLPFPFAPVAQMLRAQFEAHEQTPRETDDDIVAEFLYGRVGARRTGETTRLFVESRTEQMLYALQSDVAGHLLEVLPDLQIDWTLKPVAGSSPPNFHFAQVAGTEPVGAHFIRVRLTGRDMSPFAADNIHFRLLLPKDPDNPGWPVAGDRGQTVWPLGRDALHIPVYTTRLIGDGWLEFDVFRHDGGRTTAWAEADPVGQDVGLLGPGGGGLPRADKILFAGDETALPAIARMLEDPRCPNDVRVIVRTSAKDYPLGGAFDAVDDLAAETIAALSEDRFLWAGGPRADMQRLRDHAKSTGRAKDMMHIVNYWL